MGLASKNNSSNLYFLQVSSSAKSEINSILFSRLRFHSTVVLVDCWKNSYRHGAVETLINTMNRILM